MEDIMRANPLFAAQKLNGSLARLRGMGLAQFPRRPYAPSAHHRA